jgi:diacylglycerol kinase (ATP)
MLVIVNKKAGGGRAGKRWEGVRPELNGFAKRMKMVVTSDVSSMRAAVAAALRDGETDYVAAGGDGTVNALLNVLINETSGNVARLRLGAIGLGSSNDFHKPGVRSSVIAGCPALLDFESAQPRDVGRCIVSLDSSATTRYFLLNGSIGVTARANEFFNHPDVFLGFLKRHSTSGAIGYAALRTILNPAPIPMTVMSVETGRVTGDFVYAAVLKSPHVSGGLKFPGEALYDSGRFSVYCFKSMGRMKLAELALALSRGRSFGAGCISWSPTSCSFSASEPFAVETDGEIMRATDARFSLIPHYIKVCTC